MTLRDGRRAEHAVQSHRGDFRDPFSEAEVRAKFRDLAGEVLTPDGVTAVERVVDGGAAWDRARVLPDLLARHSRG